MAAQLGLAEIAAREGRWGELDERFDAIEEEFARSRQNDLELPRLAERTASVAAGASDDAAKLQRAVGEALEAHERASRIARATLAALDDAERSAAAAAGRPDPKRFDKPEPCECPACVRSRKGKCLAAVAAQWKWAALRTGGS